MKSKTHQLILTTAIMILFAVFSTTKAEENIMAQSKNSVDIKIEQGVAWLTIDHGEINLLDKDLLGQLGAAAQSLASNDDVKVVVVQTANPEFFLAHIDAHLLAIPKQVMEKPTELTLFHSIVELFRLMPKATIAKIKGRARGAGSEFALGMDMRFAAKSAIFGQPEIGFGFPPGGGALTRLTKVTGRARALEIMLSGQDYNADLAERYGWINRAVNDEELDRFVDKLAIQIASYPQDAIRIIKNGFNVIEETSTHDGLLEEAYWFGKGLRTPSAEARVKKFIDMNGQSIEIERDLTKVFSQMQGL